MNICSSYARCRCWNEWIEKTLLNELVLMFHCLMINDEWSGIWGVLGPPRARSMSRGKPSVRLTLDQKEVMKPETIPSLPPISESTTTRVALMISESATTRFLSTISAAAELCCLQQICNNLKTISINIYLFNSYIKGKWSKFFFFC